MARTEDPLPVRTPCTCSAGFICPACQSWLAQPQSPSVQRLREKDAQLLGQCAACRAWFAIGIRRQSRTARGLPIYCSDPCWRRMVRRRRRRRRRTEERRRTHLCGMCLARFLMWPGQRAHARRGHDVYCSPECRRTAAVRQHSRGQRALRLKAKTHCDHEGKKREFLKKE
jgi:hypothetical protein